MSEACITNHFEHINISQRDAKGYNFEVKVNNVLNDVGITYLSNPLNNIKEWKSRQGKGSDFKIPLWNWEIEAKYSNAKIFPSWIKRDYIPRFSKNSFKVVVHNEDMKLTNGSLELCFLYDVYLVEIDYLKYVLKAEIKARSRANKLIEANNSKSKVPNNINLKNTNLNIDIKNIETENRRARTEEKTESSTSREYTVSPISVGTEKCSSFDSTSDNISVEREKFLNETLSRYPLLKQNKIKSPKECPNRKYRIVVCSLKMLNPSYVCIFRVLYHIRHNNFPPYIERRGKIYICKNPKCTGEVCKTLDLTCSFLVGINKCPRMYKPPHFCLPLPKPKILPSPDLTYYFKEMNRK
jgi:hypothetical protein